MSDLLKGFLLALVAVAVLVFAAQALAAPWQHEQSWTEAVYTGLIEGDPAYYYNGDATQAEYNHALITAANQLKSDQWVPAPITAVFDQPHTYCPQNVWEYNVTPGAGYRPQAFADDNYRYDSLVMFDDFYEPVVYLNPQLGRLYEHPAGGYWRYIVCWSIDQ